MGNIAALKQALQNPSSFKKIDEAFKSYDTDRSGALNKAEFHLFAQHLKTILETLPKDHMAKKDLGESIKEFAEDLFNRADSDHNGQISFNEFVSLVHAESWH
eukprot:TRINITY_DN9789_c0_g1_i1.p1 TRINITY_DN9789_c0_g1~~TRINITY_DN9789_c0_g1_i1.p1  ORF type:complete len:115 (+),score=28.38 TRINITY_DN9789_c0_g1_i1:37-345(+)